MKDKADTNELYLDLRDVSTADIARYVVEVLGILRQGDEAPRFRLWATVLAMLRAELRRRGDSDGEGAVQGLEGVPDDVLREANRLIENGYNEDTNE